MGWGTYHQTNEYVGGWDHGECGSWVQLIRTYDPVCLMISFLSRKEGRRKCVQEGRRSKGRRTIFLCLVIPGNQAVIILVLDSTGKPRVASTRSICGTKIVWGRHQALIGRTSGHAGIRGPSGFISAGWGLALGLYISTKASDGEGEERDLQHFHE
jgi:hypothetical protein